MRRGLAAMTLRIVASAMFIVTSWLAGCTPQGEIGFIRGGVGTDLNHSALADATDSQDRYVALVCRQAGLGQISDSCATEAFRATEWSAFVQAGMNDIDARCDAYLAWLDDKRRSVGPIAQQISDIRTATSAILAVTGVGVNPMAVVSAAFGLATNTFTNFNSRLLFQLDQSTVQALVLHRQTEFRQSLLDPQRRADNRPGAIHILRSYLRICAPFTIETDVNTTITTLARGGVGAIVAQAPLIETTPAGRPFTPDTRTQEPKRAPRQWIEAYATLIANYDPREHDAISVERFLAAICVRNAKPDNIDPEATALIGVFEDTLKSIRKRASVNGVLDKIEMDQLRGKSKCVDNHRNYFESVNYPDGVLTNIAIMQLNRYLPGQNIAPGTKLENARAAIAKARQAAAAKGIALRQQGTFFADQITNDLLQP